MDSFEDDYMTATKRETEEKSGLIKVNGLPKDIIARLSNPFSTILYIPSINLLRAKPNKPLPRNRG